MNNELHEQLGPLADLIGSWEGDKGDDLAPSDDRGTENNKYRERITFEQACPVQNHEQNLHVLRYSMRAWRLGEANSFSYEQDTVIRIPGQAEPFHHRDRNSLTRVG